MPPQIPDKAAKREKLPANDPSHVEALDNGYQLVIDRDGHIFNWAIFYMARQGGEIAAGSAPTLSEAKKLAKAYWVDWKFRNGR